MRKLRARTGAFHAINLVADSVLSDYADRPYAFFRRRAATPSCNAARIISTTADELKSLANKSPVRCNGFTARGRQTRVGPSAKCRASRCAGRRSPTDVPAGSHPENRTPPHVHLPPSPRYHKSARTRTHAVRTDAN